MHSNTLGWPNLHGAAGEPVTTLASLGTPHRARQHTHTLLHHTEHSYTTLNTPTQLNNPILYPETPTLRRTFLYTLRHAFIHFTDHTYTSEHCYATLNSPTLQRALLSPWTLLQITLTCQQYTRKRLHYTATLLSYVHPTLIRYTLEMRALCQFFPVLCATLHCTTLEQCYVTPPPEHANFLTGGNSGGKWRKSTEITRHFSSIGKKWP